jgi:hypothetical protein
MADTKITALAAITTVDPAADVLPIVDISDTSMAASGTTKKVTSNQILGAGGTATLASATITGDLTVDTNVLKVDSANNRVGIGTASPNNTLTVRGTQDAGIEVNSADSNSSRLIFAYDPANTRWYINSTLSGSGTTLPLTFLIQNTEALRLNTTGNLVLKGGTAAANGVGVTFPATQVASSDANCLDDYEEGTFTPTVSATAGTLTTTTVNSATYTKIGRLVSVSVDISVVNIGTASGLLLFSLPFNQVADSNVGALRELGATGQMGQIIYQSATQVAVALYNNGTMIVNGYRFRGTYTYTV